MAKPHLTHDKDNNAITWQVGWSDFLEKWTLGMLCQIIKGPTFFFEMLIRFESENFVAHALRARPNSLNFLELVSYNYTWSAA